MYEILPWHKNVWKCINKNRKTSQILLIIGLQGIGKFNLAKNFAHSLLCDNLLKDNIPCGRCHACLLFNKNNHPDFLLVQSDNSHIITIEQIRIVIKEIFYTTHQGRVKIIIIKDADLLNISAANLLLKILEEPPSQTMIILTTSNIDFLFSTIRSRCKILTIPIPEYSICENWLRQKITDINHVKLLLSITNNAPLLALNLFNNNWLYERQTLLSNLYNFLYKKMTLGDVIIHFLNLDIKDFLQFFYYIIHDLIKIKLTVNYITNSDHINQLYFYAKKANLKKLLILQEQMCYLNYNYIQHINFNKQMLMENILLNFINMLE